MKRIIYFFIVALITSSIIYSCKKDNNEESSSVATLEENSHGLNVEGLIINFKQKLDYIRENPALKVSGEPMSVDSAVWYLEATANYTYGDAGYETGKFVIDSSFITIPVNDGEISYADLQIAYDQAIDSLSAQYAAVDASSKQLIVADFSVKETSEDVVTLEVSSGIGTNSALVIGDDHSWYWGWEMGTCDGSGYGIGWDAADKIAQLANYGVSVPTGTGYYIDITEREVWYWDVPTDNNPYGDYLLFHDFQVGTLDHHCLSINEVAYYKSELGIIANMYKPSGTNIIRYFCHDETAFMLCGPQEDDCWDMCHVAIIRYGTWVSGGGGLEL